MMLDRKSATSEYLHALFQKNQLDLVPEIELSSNDLLIDLARIGLGIACGIVIVSLASKGLTEFISERRKKLTTTSETDVEDSK